MTRGTQEENMDMERLLTKEKAGAICAKIAKGLEDNKIVGSANVIAYAMKQAWFAGFVEGRKHPVKDCGERSEGRRRKLVACGRPAT
jgi:hypothetical protein